MNIIKTASSKRAIIVSVALCGLGIYLFSSFETTQMNENVMTNSGEPLPLENQADIQMSTSELISASVQRVHANTLNKQISYPNVTPKKLDSPFSPTLEGTDIDGQLRVGEDGLVVVNIEVKDFFDYFLSTTAEVSPELALDELLRVASQSLPPENFQEVQKMLDNYLAYKESAINLMSQPMLPHEQQTHEYQLQMMEEGIQGLRALRREHMPESQVEAFFGLEEAYEDYTLASIKIQSNPDLSTEQKQAELQAQRNLLPEVIRNTENRMADDAQISQEVNELLLSDIRDSELENKLRNKGLSETAIDDALDYRKQQRDFENQYSQYKIERDQLLSSGLSEEDLIAQKEQLLQKYFESEQTITQAKVKDLSS